MKKSLLIIAPVAMLALAACNKTETPAAGTEAEGVETAAAPVELPPAIVDSGAYRCGDGTVLYVDFFGNEGKDGAKVGAAISVGAKGKDTVRVEAPKVEAPAAGAAAPAADAAAPAGPMKSADGEASLSGGGASINVKLPGKGAQTCKG